MKAIPIIPKATLEIKGDKIELESTMTPLQLMQAGCFLMNTACDKIGDNSPQKPTHKQFANLCIEQFIKD